MITRHHGGNGIRLMDSSHAWSYAGAAGVTAGDVRPLLAVLAGEGMFGADLSWQDDAPCGQADGDAWFPEKGESSRAAKMICRSCPARLDCLRYALDRNEEFGVWAGLSREEREAAARARGEGLGLAAILRDADAAWDATMARAAGQAAAAGRRGMEVMLTARAGHRAALGLPASPAPQPLEEVA